MKNIYIEHFENIEFEFSVNENIYSNEETFEIYENYIKSITEYHLIKDIRQNAINTIIAFAKPCNSYAIVKFEEYYGLVQIADDFEPRTVYPKIYLFDKNRCYPLQCLEEKITYKYN